MNLELLKTKREARGLKQEEVAILLGYKSKSNYCLLENGKKGITVEEAKKLKEILKLSKKDFDEIFFS